MLTLTGGLDILNINSSLKNDTTGKISKPPVNVNMLGWYQVEVLHRPLLWK